MITQKEIGEKLGLSPSTVASILGGSASLRYSKKTRELVVQTAKKCGYQPNRASRAVQRGRSNLLGIIHFGLALEIARKVAFELPQAINAAGYDYMVVDIQWHGGSIERVLNEMIQARVEGVIISNMMEAFGSEYIEILNRAGIPVVSVYGDDRLNIVAVSNDMRSAFCEMGLHLQKVGHQCLLLTIGESQARPVKERIDGLEKALGEPCPQLKEEEFFQGWADFRKQTHGSTVGIVVQLKTKSFSYDFAAANYAFSQRLFSTDILPDAIMCSNDQGAFGVFNAATERGLSIPRDLAVTGADDDKFGKYPMFGLTTIRSDVAQSCAAGVNLLKDLIQKKTSFRASKTFQSELVLRTSCGRSNPMGGEQVAAETRAFGQDVIPF